MEHTHTHISFRFVYTLNTRLINATIAGSEFGLACYGSAFIDLCVQIRENGYFWISISEYRPLFFSFKVCQYLAVHSRVVSAFGTSEGKHRKSLGLAGLINYPSSFITRSHFVVVVAAAAGA